MKRFFVLLLGLLGPFGVALGSEGWAYTRTNLVDRWITNTTEIHMQVNRFVTEFHTNWVKHVETNFVNLFSTNFLTQYHTNWITKVRTNLVDRFATNIVAKTLTNTLVVEQFR